MARVAQRKPPQATRELKHEKSPRCHQGMIALGQRWDRQGSHTVPTQRCVALAGQTLVGLFRPLPRHVVRVRTRPVVCGPPPRRVGRFALYLRHDHCPYPQPPAVAALPVYCDPNPIHPTHYRSLLVPPPVTTRIIFTFRVAWVLPLSANNLRRTFRPIEMQMCPGAIIPQHKPASDSS